MRNASASSARLAVISIGIAAALATSSLCAWAGGPTKLSDPGPARMRPFSDFVAAQGGSYFAWEDNPVTQFAVVDYLGLTNANVVSNGGTDAGTQVTGSVMERPLADGRAEVTVTIHTTNALTYVLAEPSGNLTFGYTGGELIADHSLAPAVSDANLKFVFTNTAPGDPLPSMITLAFGTPLPGQAQLQVKVASSGFGPLRAASGSPEGTPGRCGVVQTGLYITSGMGATADAFPVENINVGPVGPGAAGATPVSLGAPGLDVTNGSATPLTGSSQHTSWGRIKALYH
jgi:hypothetical protein